MTKNRMGQTLSVPVDFKFSKLHFLPFLPFVAMWNEPQENIKSLIVCGSTFLALRRSKHFSPNASTKIPVLGGMKNSFHGSPNIGYTLYIAHVVYKDVNSHCYFPTTSQRVNI